MAVSLSLRGATGGTDLHLGDTALPFGTLALVGYAVEVYGTGAMPVGTLTQVGYAAAVTQVWGGISPYGALALVGYTALVQAEIQSQNIETVTGSLGITGYAVEFSTLPRFAPVGILAGYSSDGTNITFPISSLPGLSVAEANTTTGDWRDLFQALCLLNHEWFTAIQASRRPQTVSSFMLENWRHHSTTFGYTMRRTITVDFIVENVPPNIFE